MSGALNGDLWFFLESPTPIIRSCNWPLLSADKRMISVRDNYDALRGAYAAFSVDSLRVQSVEG